jgi:proline iminopeptidase
MDQLVDLLRTEFGKDKVLLVCHSWGTQVCLSYLSRHAGKALAYIAVGQVVNQTLSDQEGYDWALAEARRRGNVDDIAGLESIGPPPYALDRLLRQREFIWKYGGTLHKSQSLWQMALTAMTSPETSWMDYFAFKAGGEISIDALWDDLQSFDAARDHPRLEVPAFFIHGRHDRQVSAHQAKTYFESLVAPQKELIWFENSAHAPPFEEPERFNAQVRRIARDVKAN